MLLNTQGINIDHDATTLPDCRYAATQYRLRTLRMSHRVFKAKCVCMLISHISSLFLHEKTEAGSAITCDNSPLPLAPTQTVSVIAILLLY